MKNYKILALGLLILTSLNAKDLVPKELIGNYSADANICTMQDNTIRLMVSKHMFSWWEDDCKVIKVNSLKNGSYDIDAQCMMEGEPYEAQFNVKKFNNKIQVGESIYFSCK